MKTTWTGLTQTEAEQRIRTVGPNEVAQARPQGWPIRLLKIARNPLVILLATLSAVSFISGDARAGTVMAVMVALSVTLRFLQEARADAAAAKLKAMIHVTATVIRNGEAKEAPLRDLAPGDVVKLSAGDMIPGDVRVLTAKDLYVSQGSLTGESLPVEKFHDVESKDLSSPIELKNTCFMGTSVEGGVTEGRKVFANILKYVRMGASSNFGNMFSVLGASAFLPFIPMAPIQVLTNNLLYDFAQVPIPMDSVDEEQVARPRPWNINEIKRFILFIGPISSIFDYTTFFVMLYVFNCWDPSRAAVFQTGWFVESLMTQTLIIHVIRTNKIPFLQSRASLPLTFTSFSIMAVGAWLPSSPAAASLGLTNLPGLYWLILLLTLLAYVVATQLIKVWLLRMKWI